MQVMRPQHTHRRRNPRRCLASVYELTQVAGPPPAGVRPPTSFIATSTRVQRKGMTMGCRFGWSGSKPEHFACLIPRLVRACMPPMVWPWQRHLLSRGKG